MCPTPGRGESAAPGLVTDFRHCGHWTRVRENSATYDHLQLDEDESEVGEIEAAVKAHRLVTLTGVGEVGKTRLALEVAAQLADDPDGVWVFELAAVTDPAACPMRSAV